MNYRLTRALLFVAFTLLFSPSIFAQNQQGETEKLNSLYFVAGGHNWGIGIGYDRLLSERISVASEVGYYYYGYGLSLVMNYLILKSPHRAEIGAGFVTRPHPSSNSGTSPAMSLGYRFQKNEGGMFFQIHYVPIWYWDEPASSSERRLYTQSWFSLSIGRSF